MHSYPANTVLNTELLNTKPLLNTTPLLNTKPLLSTKPQVNVKVSVDSIQNICSLPTSLLTVSPQGGSVACVVHHGCVSQRVAADNHVGAWHHLDGHEHHASHFRDAGARARVALGHAQQLKEGLAAPPAQGQLHYKGALHSAVCFLSVTYNPCVFTLHSHRACSTNQAFEDACLPLPSTLQQLTQLCGTWALLNHQVAKNARALHQHFHQISTEHPLANAPACSRTRRRWWTARALSLSSGTRASQSNCLRRRG